MANADEARRECVQKRSAARTLPREESMTRFLLWWAESRQRKFAGSVDSATIPANGDSDAVGGSQVLEDVFGASRNPVRHRPPTCDGLLEKSLSEGPWLGEILHLAGRRSTAGGESLFKGGEELAPEGFAEGLHGQGARRMNQTKSVPRNATPQTLMDMQ